MVPDPFAGTPFTNQPIEFADYSGSRNAAGLPDAVGFQAYVSAQQGDRRPLYQGLPSPGAGLKDHLVKLNELLAIDLYGFDLGVWVTQQDPRLRNFIVLQGSFDKDALTDKLLGLGYEEASHNEVVYYRLFEEAAVDLSHPLGVMAPHLNRIAFIDDKLLLGSSDLVIHSLIDVQLENVPSLRENSTFIRLARSSGQGVLGGVLLDQRWIKRTLEQRSGQWPAVADGWGTLASYQLALLGYRQTSGSGQTVVALIHPRINSAERNSGELQARWDSLFMLPSPQDQSSTPTDKPRSDRCSSFTTEVFEQRDIRQPKASGTAVFGSTEYSVLNGTCRITDNGVSAVSPQGPEIWRTIYESGQLAMLARNGSRQ